MTTTTTVGNCCCVLPPQCCCDENGKRIIYGNDQCQGQTFNAPQSVPALTIVFEWCGLVAEYTLAQGGTPSYYATQNIDTFVCNTDGRYGEGVSSYTRATRKELSVYIYPGNSSNYCGFDGHFLASATFEGAGFRRFDDGNYYGWENNILVVELYDCTISMCFDGSEPDVSMTLIDSSQDDSCGGAGCFDPCKFTAPEAVLTLAP